jgi:hypothetical protein
MRWSPASPDLHRRSPTRAGSCRRSSPSRASLYSPRTHSRPRAPPGTRSPTAPPLGSGRMITSGGRSIRRWCRLVTTSSTLLKAGPAGGRLRRPSSAGSATTATEDPASPATQPAPPQQPDRRVVLHRPCGHTHLRPGTDLHMRWSRDKGLAEVQLSAAQAEVLELEIRADGRPNRKGRCRPRSARSRLGASRPGSPCSAQSCGTDLRIGTARRRCRTTSSHGGHRCGLRRPPR